MNDPFAVARARRALTDAGQSPDVELERADSVTNEVWLTPTQVLRVNRHPNQRLRREAFLGPKLPLDVGYPRVIAYGGELGADWLLLERRPGGPLSRAWPQMTRDERRRAVGQLATILRRLHGFEAPEGLPPTAAPQLLSARTLRAVDPLLDGLDRAEQLPHVDRRMIGDLRSMALDTCAALDPFGATTLIHGDVHFENLLWDGYVITALLDFEYARPAPPDLELDVFLRFCAFPYLHVAADYEHLTRAEDYLEVPWWMAEDYPELFDHPMILERCRLYCMAYDVRDLLESPPPRPPRELSPHHAHNRLERLARNDSHLERFAGRSSSMDWSPASLSVGGPQIPEGPPPLAGGAVQRAPSMTPLPRRSER